MMDCEELTSKLTDYLEGHLPYGERMGVWLHLVMCEHCNRYYEQIRTVIDYSKELGSDESSSSLDDETKEELREEYREVVKDDE